MSDCDVSSPESSITVLQAIVHGGRVAEARLDAALDVLGLSLVKWYALQHLVEAGGALPLGALADRLACVKSNVTQLVDRLEADALVQRKPDPDDRRSILAQITGEGRRRYHEGRQSLELLEQEIDGRLAPEERLQLRRLLERVERRPS